MGLGPLTLPPPPSPGLAVHRSPSKRAEIMLRKKTERKEKEEDFDVGMRNSAMEFDAMDADRSHSLEFDEFSKLVREREVGVFSEQMLRERFDAISDGDGHVTFHSYIMNQIKEAFFRAGSDTDIEEVLGMWDQDGNNEVDKYEFRRIMRTYGFKASDGELDSIFRSFDCIDSNGSIDQHELAKMLQDSAAHQTKARALRRAGLTAGKQFDEVEIAQVAALDTSKGLDSKEGRQAFKEQLQAAIDTNGARVIDAFRQWDKDGSGTIDVREFYEAVKGLGFGDVKMSEVKDLFKLFDKDGGGYVDYNELNRLLRKRSASPEPSSSGRASPAAKLIDGGDSFASGASSIPVPTNRGPLQMTASVRREHRGVLDATRRPRALHGVKVDLDAKWSLMEQLTGSLRQKGSRGRDLFREWDLEGMGSLSRINLRKAMEPLGVQDAQAVDALFDSLAGQSDARQTTWSSPASRASPARSSRDSSGPGTSDEAGQSSEAKARVVSNASPADLEEAKAEAAAEAAAGAAAETAREQRQQLLITSSRPTSQRAPTRPGASLPADPRPSPGLRARDAENRAQQMARQAAGRIGVEQLTRVFGRASPLRRPKGDVVRSPVAMDAREYGNWNEAAGRAGQLTDPYWQPGRRRASQLTLAPPGGGSRPQSPMASLQQSTSGGSRGHEKAHPLDVDGRPWSPSVSAIGRSMAASEAAAVLAMASCSLPPPSTAPAGMRRSASAAAASSVASSSSLGFLDRVKAEREAAGLAVSRPVSRPGTSPGEHRLESGGLAFGASGMWGRSAQLDASTSAISLRHRPDWRQRTWTPKAKLRARELDSSRSRDQAARIAEHASSSRPSGNAGRHALLRALEVQRTYDVAAPSGYAVWPYISGTGAMLGGGGKANRGPWSRPTTPEDHASIVPLQMPTGARTPPEQQLPREQQQQRRPMPTSSRPPRTDYSLHSMSSSAVPMDSIVPWPEPPDSMDMEEQSQRVEEEDDEAEEPVEAEEGGSAQVADKHQPQQQEKPGERRKVNHEEEHVQSSHLPSMLPGHVERSFATPVASAKLVPSASAPALARGANASNPLHQGQITRQQPQSRASLMQGGQRSSRSGSLISPHKASNPTLRIGGRRPNHGASDIEWFEAWRHGHGEALVPTPSSLISTRGFPKGRAPKPIGLR